jgi:archaemetzincin
VRGCIAVIPLGKIPEIACRVIAEHIQSDLGLESEILPPLEVPVYALDQNRLQYNAATILKSFESKSYHKHIKIIAVLNVDLFIPVFTHVFGEAREGGKCALISMFRLIRNVDGSEAGMPKILERIAKVALHEAAHLFDVVHCTDAHCLMHFSMNLEALDSLPLNFCRYCTAFLQESIRRRISK